MTLAVAVAISLPAALQSARREIHGALKVSTRTHSGGAGARRWREVLLILQVAISFQLVAMGGALAKNLFRRIASKGFDGSGVVYLRVDYKHTPLWDNQEPFIRKVLERAARLPGVLAAALAFPEPLADEQDQNDPSRFLIQSVTPGLTDGEGKSVRRTVGGDFAGALRIPVRRGRWLDPNSGDEETVIDENFAARFFPGRDPIGRKLRPVSADFDFTIVGVVGNVKHSLTEELAPTYYLDYQNHTELSTVFLVRTSGDLQETARALARVVREVEPRQAIASVGRYSDLIALHMISDILQALVTVGLALVAMLLAALGLAGSALAWVVARTNEIGLRAAIGSSPGRILALVLRQSLRPLAIGLAVGQLLVLAAFDSPAFRLLAPGVPTLNWKGGLAAAAVVLLTAVVALLIPALRAARLKPHSALRYE